VVKNYQYVR